MRGDLSVLETLWESTPPPAPPVAAGAPDMAHRYLAHAIAPGTGLATAVRLRMHGEIRLGRWWPFTAEEVIRRDRGMIWRAAVRMHGLPVRGSDRLLDGDEAFDSGGEFFRVTVDEARYR